MTDEITKLRAALKRQEEINSQIVTALVNAYLAMSDVNSSRYPTSTADAFGSLSTFSGEIKKLLELVYEEDADGQQ